MLSKISTCALAATACVARTVPEPTLASPWSEKAGQAMTASKDMDISMVLPSTNMDKLKDFAQWVSDPLHEMYGQHLSMAEINAFTAPEAHHVDRVLTWLRSHGVEAKVTANHNIVFSASPSKVEELFATQVRTVRNQDTGMTKQRATAFTVPEYLDESVTTVLGLHGMPLPPRKAVKVQGGGRPVNVNPETIITRYQVGGVNVTRGVTNRQAVAEFQGQNAEQKDLNEFFKRQVKSYVTGDELIYKVVGVDGRFSGTEAALDIQYIMGVAPGIKTEFWGYPGNDFCKDLNDFTSQILSTPDFPKVFSVSYGWQGELSQLGCRNTDISTTNDNLAKIAASGISMLVSSGDSGSQFQGEKLYPSWPASSPWVTAVGGTRFEDQDVHGDEMATDQFGSGGGFSYDFTRRDAQWQEAGIQAYLAKVTHLPPASEYNTNGRGTPDVSGIAEGYAVYSGGMLQSVGGTSASAPMFAGLVSLCNEARAAVGKPPLGLLNAFLYQNADAFTDVTKGTGAISRNGQKMAEGWDTATGWDAATGLGTPIFPKLVEAAKNA